MKEITLTQGQVAIVDDADYDSINAFKWYAQWSPYTKSFCAVRNMPIGGGKWTKVLMHRVITGAPKGSDVDHVNMATLDNRRANLRVCTASNNQHNRGKQANNKSGHKGVTWDKLNGKWRAQIGHLGKMKFLGLFDHVLDAAAAYDRAALDLHGTFARVNERLEAWQVAEMNDMSEYELGVYP